MKVNIRTQDGKIAINFKISPMPKNEGLIAIPENSNELDKLQSAISNTNEVIGNVVAKAVENKLKLPVEVYRDYKGAGYGLKFDMYSIAKSLK